MTIDPRMAMQCAETACGAIFSAREYPRARCPLCGSEAVSLAAEEAKRLRRAAGEGADLSAAPWRRSDEQHRD